MLLTSIIWHIKADWPSKYFNFIKKKTQSWNWLLYIIVLYNHKITIQNKIMLLELYLKKKRKEKKQNGTQ